MAILNLTSTSPAQSFTEPITRAEVEKFLGLTTPDPWEESYVDEIDMLRQGAREQAELFQRRDLAGKQWDLTMDAFPAGQIRLRDYLSTVDLVQYKNSAGTTTALVANTDYIVDTVQGLIQPVYGGSWPSFTPWPSSAVTIRFTTSPPAISAHLKLGMLSLISEWYNNRLPFATGQDAAQGYPTRLLMLLSSGAREVFA